MTGVQLTVGAVLLLANAVFVAAEFALVAARRSRLQELAAGGDRRATDVLVAMADLPRTLAATQLGITVASIGLGFTVEAAVEGSVVPVLEHVLPLPPSMLEVTAAVLALGTVAAAHTLLGEMVPKNLAVALPERTALWLGPPIRAFAAAVRPAVAVLAALAEAVLRALRVEPVDELAAGHGVQEISDMLELAGRTGAIGAVEHEMLGRALRFAGMAAADVMVPWSRVTAAEAGTPPAAMERRLLADNHSRLPVLDRGRVLGFVNLLDLQRAGGEPPLRPVLTVPGSRRLVDVFDELRQGSGRLAVVLGDTGEPVGLVTLEDLLEELLGELAEPRS